LLPLTRGPQRTSAPRRVCAVPPRPPPKAGIMTGIYAAGDRENVYPARFAEYVARLAPPWMTTMRVALARTDKVLPQGEFFVGLGSANLRLLDLLGVRFLVEGPGPRGLDTV